MSKYLELQGKKFGKLVATRRTPQKENGYFMWECKCECGGFIRVSSKKLQRGTVTDCGCVPKTKVLNGSIAEDITGQRFGLLTAVRREKSKGGKTQWLCVCECGHTKIAETSMLKAGKTWHCGCATGRMKNSSKLDLLGKRFGRLIAVRQTKERNSKGSVIWECSCDCGKTVHIAAEHLVSGNTKSCGCLKQEKQKKIGDQLTFYDGTCIDWLRSRKNRSDNTSGFRGVYKRGNKWMVSIGLKGKRYYCGMFENFEDAKNTRLEVEKVLHDGLVEAWDKWKRIADADSSWAEKNRFRYDVKRTEHGFEVECSVPDIYLDK